VYDGDTITIARKASLLWKSRIYSYKVRLSGIDCPEIRGSSDEEKFYAQKAKKIVEELVLNNEVKMNVTGYDKYGRILASVMINDIDIGQHLLNIGLAVPYDGRAKAVVNWKEHYTSKCVGSMIETVKR
jgi:endonuclease YncB( thermonuclease family)